MAKSANADDSGNPSVVTNLLTHRSESDHSAARSRGLDATFVDSFLGFRCAPPQALCLRLLRRLDPHFFNAL
jgi:hypothetical protein